MKELFSPPVFPGSVTAIVDDYIKNIFKEYSSDNVAMFDTVWHFRYVDEIVDFFNRNQNKHILALSASDPFPFQPREPFRQYDNLVYEKLATHAEGVTYVGNVYTENYFSFWLEFFRHHHHGRFEFDYNSVDIEKVYMTLNRKPHDHRVELVSQLYANNLQQDGFISLGYHSHDGRDYKDLPVPILLEDDVVNEEGNKAVLGNVPGISCDISSLGSIDNWKKFFVNVVAETNIGTVDFISEKSLKPIMGYKPFIIFGCTAQYEILHKWGIDTFDDIFGFDYADSRWPIDTTVQCKKITNILQDLKKENLNLLYKSLLPRLIENRKALINAMEENHNQIIETAKKF